MHGVFFLILLELHYKYDLFSSFCSSFKQLKDKLFFLRNELTFLEKCEVRNTALEKEALKVQKL